MSVKTKYDDKQCVVANMAEKGCWLVQIAETTGIPLGSLNYYMAKWGIQVNKSNRKSHFRNTKAMSEQLKNRHALGLMQKGGTHWKYCKLKLRGEWVPEEEVKEELEYYVDQDLFLVDIAKIMEVGIKTIYNWRDKFGIVIEKRQGKRVKQWKGGHRKYRGADWKIQRLEALERDNYVCQHCGKTDNENRLETGSGLQVHHITPFSKDENNELDNLVSLCNSCHKRIHIGKLSNGYLSHYA